MSFATVDFETSYSKDRDIRSLGVVPYLAHPETDIYLVSIAFPDGSTWAGDPRVAPWDKIQHLPWVSHNRSFDLAVYRELQRRKVVLRRDPPAWHCSADLMAYIQAPRALAKASKMLLRTEVSKVTRDEMRGQDYRRLTPEKQRKVQEYARADALLCWMLWRDHHAAWPEEERWLSRHTTDMGLNGIAYDAELASRDRDALLSVIWSAEKEIPWVGEAPPSSRNQLMEECRRAGIEPPETTDAKSEVFDIWADKYASRAPFVAAVQKWRRANRLLKVIDAMMVRNVEGRVRYNLKYFGAIHTGRWSGDTGLNLQNLPRKAFECVDVRAHLIPAHDHSFIVSDLSQVEARVALWLAEDGDMLRMLSTGMDLYEAHARATMGYTDPRPLKLVDPDMRQFAKCRVLGLGFGLGATKFQRIVKQWAGIDITPKQAYDIVSDFRRKNEPILGIWRYLERTIRRVRDPKTKEPVESSIQLPSGRVIRYFDVREVGEGNWVGSVEQGDFPKRLYGGALLENAVQATAREILASKIREVEGMGLRVVLHVHDELVVECPNHLVDGAKHVVARIMSTAPRWAADSGLEYRLPLMSETTVVKRYGK